jgi:cytochrome c oxidase subunit 4
MGYLNIGQMIFVIIAWVLPIINLIKVCKSWVLLSLVSLASAGASLCMRLLYNDYLVHISDWSALMDTSNFMTIVSCVLFIGAMLLNSLVFHKNKSRD